MGLTQNSDVVYFQDDLTQIGLVVYPTVSIDAWGDVVYGLTLSPSEMAVSVSATVIVSQAVPGAMAILALESGSGNLPVGTGSMSVKNLALKSFSQVINGVITLTDTVT